MGARADDIRDLANDVINMTGGIQNSTIKSRITSDAEDMKTRISSLEDKLEILLDELAELENQIARI